MSADGEREVDSIFIHIEVEQTKGQILQFEAGTSIEKVRQSLKRNGTPGLICVRNTDPRIVILQKTGVLANGNYSLILSAEVQSALIQIELLELEAQHEQEALDAELLALNAEL